MQLNKNTSEAEFSRFVDRVRSGELESSLLIDTLSYGHPLYQGRSTNCIVRMRGYTLASFEYCGLPQEALCFVLEELESGRHPYLIAAAAKALRGYDCDDSSLPGHLLRGIENIQYCDDAISFDQYFMTWPAPQGYTTGVKEVLRTLLRYAKFASDYVDALDSMLGNPAYDTDAKGLIKQIIERLETTPVQQRCCSAPLTQDLGKNRVTGVDSAKVAGVRFEDQHSREHGYHSLFKNKVSAVAFFYTRCQNPSKCSLTVTKLAALQRLVGHDNLQVVAITYDPEYDTPDRLRTYCEHRGMRFDDSTKALRSLGSSLDVIRDYFRLGASYSGSLVNAHQIELYLIDAQARVVGAFVNLQWQPQEVAREMYEIQVSRPIPAFP